ncbi:MAG: peptidyl-prolyl cis-trans isomerase [Ignavibacteriae bacterium]|nr:peptidyl-prolyl cis-trans isomerase [Ignavibacteriota bacterium]
MRKFQLLILLFIFSSNIYPQKKEEIVAKVGDKIITAEEFKYRFELTPQIKRKNSEKGMQKAKEELLYTLIAEKLLAIEAEKNGYDSSASMKMNYIPMEKMHVRDALYKKEIKNKVSLNKEKIKEGISLANKKYFVDYVYTQSKDAIDIAYNELKNSKNYDSTAALLKNVEFVKEPYEVIYGKMAIEPESAIFSLELNQFTTPQQSPEGWYIFRLINKSSANFKSFEDKVALVEKTVKKRNEDSLYDSFLYNFLKDKKVTTDGSLFWYIVDSLQPLVEKVKVRENVAANEKIQISDEDFTRFRNSLNPDSLKKVFIKFENNPLTLNDFLNEFMFEGFYTYSSDMNNIAEHLNQRVRRQIEMEILTRYGYELGLENLDEVKSDTEIWKNNYLATLYRKDLVLETKNIFEQENSISQNDSVFIETKFKIVEILTDSLEIIQQALSIADDTEELKKFAKIHTQRDLAKINGGEFEYFSQSEFGEIGKITSTMEIGDVYGPLQTEGKYSLFKLIDKKEMKIENSNVDISKNNSKNILYKKALENLENKTIELAEKYGISINEKLLNSMKLNNVQMMVVRYMGFGGSILAFPYVSPFYNWKEKLEQKQKEPL